MYEVLSFIWIPNSFKIVDLTESPPGYFNPLNDLKCSRPCGYPTYGVRCGDECACLEVDCHHVTGCPVTSEYISDISSTLKCMHTSFLHRI